MRSHLWLLTTSSVVRLAPVLVVVAVAVNLNLAGSFAVPYWLDLTARSTGALMFIGPGLAAAAAWDAARWVGLVDRGSVRGFSAAWLHTATLSVVVAGVGYGVSLVIFAIRVPPEAGSPPIGLALVSLLAVLTYSSFGFALGRLLPRMYAVVTAFAITWAWLAYTPTLETFWWRNVTGSFGTTSFGVEMQLARHALLAPAVWLGGLLAGSVAVVCAARPVRTLACVAAPVVLMGTFVAAGLARGLGPDPTELRGGHQVCAEGVPVICAWPEHASRLSRAVLPLRRTVASLRRFGIAEPPMLKETSNESVHGVWSFSLNGADAAAWASSFWSSPLANLSAACGSQDGSPAMAQIYPQLAAWLAVQAGGTVDEAAQSYGIPPPALRAFVKRSDHDQGRWFDTAVQRLRSCR